jgi:hypothetical protein
MAWMDELAFWNDTRNTDFLLGKRNIKPTFGFLAIFLSENCECVRLGG